MNEQCVKRDFIICDICKRKIYRSDDRYHGDDVCELDGLSICEDCVAEYVRDHTKELI